SKYPDAKFIGSINETIDWKKDGIYPVTDSGKLNIHGVEKDRTVAGTLSIKDGVISINSQFDISCSDHNIKIPSMMSEKIAEIVTVTISGSYSLYVKPVK